MAQERPVTVQYTHMYITTGGLPVRPSWHLINSQQMLFSSWVRQSKLTSHSRLRGIYLRTGKVRSFISTHLLVSLLLFPNAAFIGLNLCPQQGDHCWSGKVRQKIILVPAVQLLTDTCLGCYWPRSLGMPWDLFL